MITDTKTFRSELDKVNSWWITSKVSELENKPFIKREIFPTALKELGSKRILIVTGPRRVGKTVLLKQLIQQLLPDNQRNILYYSLDDPTLFTYSDNLLKDLIDYFLENIAREGKKYIFLDEVHLYKDWYKWIKSYFDRYDDIKFVLSGSSSLRIQKEANEYLRGRTFEIELFPLDFSEFLKLNNVKLDLDLDFEKIRKIEHLELQKIYEKIKKHFEEFLLVGSFPEWFEVKDKDRWFKMLIDDIPKKAVYEDVIKLFGIKNPSILENIFAFIVANQSKILSYEKINQIANLDRSALVNYIEYLKSSYLVIEILKYAPNVKEQLKSMKKYLCIDQGLRNAMLKNYEISESNLGFIIENIVGLHLFLITKKRNWKLFYVKENGEVDFLIKNKESIAVEIKYRANIKENDIEQFQKFIQKIGLKKGIVVTKDLFDKVNNIILLPAWYFLLLK